jgi:predicted type IV restriction endonuclease
MDFIDRLRDIAARIPRQLEYIQTEEATKNAFIMPFIAALGYDVFNPLEVTPELHADVGLKKGEKVDYAILRDGKPIMLFECKHHAADLSKEHASQLYRYFSVTDARFGVLTNGIAYWFYTDLEAPNKMDSKPFFEFNMLDMREPDVEELKKFTKAVFDLSGILTAASELKYTREIKRLMTAELQAPSEEFVKFFAGKVYHGKFTAAVREQFAQTTQRALRQFVTDQLNERLKSALGASSPVVPEPIPTSVPVPVAPDTAAPTDEPGRPAVVTTDEERDAFLVVRAILREVVDVKRIAMRDQQTYCGILLDDNNRRPLIRFYFNGSKKQIGLFDNAERKEEKLPLTTVDDLFGLAPRLKATLAVYEHGKS